MTTGRPVEGVGDFTGLVEPVYEAYTKAVNDWHFIDNYYTDVYSSFSSHEWDGSTGTYVSLRKAVEYKAVVPDGSNLESWWVVKIKGPPWAWEERERFNPLGSGLVFGWNKLTAENGYFINDRTPPPFIGSDEYVGWDTDLEYVNGVLMPGIVYADFNPVFNFKEEDQNA